jgi:hypothetical protein
MWMRRKVSLFVSDRTAFIIPRPGRSHASLLTGPALFSVLQVSPMGVPGGYWIRLHIRSNEG